MPRHLWMQLQGQKGGPQLQDLLTFLVYRCYCAQSETVVPWAGLKEQFPQDDSNPRRLKQNVKRAVTQLRLLWPEVRKAFDQSFGKSLRYELKDTGVSVTLLQPGPVDTDFFNRAGAAETQVGTEGKHESEPYDVAKQGFKALMAGDAHVYAASLKTKFEGAVMGMVPDALQGAMHEKMMEAAKK